MHKKTRSLSTCGFFILTPVLAPVLTPGGSELPHNCLLSCRTTRTKALLEAIDAAAAIDNLLLAGEEGVAV